MTLAETLRDAAARLERADIEDAHLESDVLLRHALGMSRETLFTRLQEEIELRDQEQFDALLERRLAGEPTAYIVGHKEFYGLDFSCSPAALIPRSETELLVETAIEWVESLGSTLGEPLIVDVGTGNGAIAVALAVNLPLSQVIAIDTSRPALLLARENARAQGVARRIAFVQGSLLGPVRARADVIVANLPYIPNRTYAQLQPEIRDHEPESALRAGRRGTTLIEELLKQAPAQLCEIGLLLAEHGWNQGRRLRESAAAQAPDAASETRRDLAGLERMLAVVRGAEERGRAVRTA